MAKKLKETDIQTYIHTDRLPLVVLSAALQQKIAKSLRNILYSFTVNCCTRDYLYIAAKTIIIVLTTQ